MGYALLWIENLTASLLLTAALLACLGKIRQRWLSLPLAVVAVLLPLAVYAATLALTGYLRERGAMIGLFYPLLVSAICYTVGGVWLLLRGLRRETDSSVSINAGRWPGGRLAAALVVVLVLHAMTFSSLDAAVKQQLAAVQAEAGALALSVAPLQVADSQNAALVYQHAFEVMNTDNWPAVWEQAVKAIVYRWHAVAEEAVFDYASAELGEFLEQHAGEMAVIRKAATWPECRFDYGRPKFEMLLSEQDHLQNAARLLAVDARYKAATGDLSGAVENINAIFAMARHVASEPLIITSFVSMGIHSIGIQTLEAVLMSAPVTAKDLETLELHESVSYRRILARSFRMEEATGLLLFSAAEGGQLNTMLFEELGLDDLFETPGIPSLYRVFHLAEDLDSYRRYFRRFHMVIANPYYLARDEMQDVEETIKSEGAGVLTSIILPGLQVGLEAAQRTEANHRAAVLGVATCRYQAKYGRLPAALGDLSPEFINIIPCDPFDGEQMRFKLTDQQCVIYSIGPDLVDNGGSLLNVQDRTGDVQFVVASPATTTGKHLPESGEAQDEQTSDVVKRLRQLEGDFPRQFLQSGQTDWPEEVSDIQRELSRLEQSYGMGMGGPGGGALGSQGAPGMGGMGSMGYGGEHGMGGYSGMGRGGEPSYRQRIDHLKSVLGDSENTHEEKVKAKQEIEALLNKYFDEDIETRQAKFAEIEQRVAKLKDQLQKRLTAKSELIQLQMKLIENEAAGLGFFGAPKAKK